MSARDGERPTGMRHGWARRDNSALRERFRSGSCTCCRICRRGSVHEVAAVKLQRWLVGNDAHPDSCLRFVHYCRNAVSRVQNEVVVVSLAVCQRLVIGVYALSDECRSGEIHWRVLHRSRLACRNECGVGKGELVRIYLQQMRVGGFVRRAVQIEIAVARRIDDGRRVGRGRVFYHYRIIIGEYVLYVYIHIARVSLFAVGRKEREGNRLLSASDGPNPFGVPHLAPPAGTAAVKMVFSVVNRRSIVFRRA